MFLIILAARYFSSMWLDRAISLSATRWVKFFLLITDGQYFKPFSRRRVSVSLKFEVDMLWTRLKNLWSEKDVVVAC